MPGFCCWPRSAGAGDFGAPGRLRRRSARSPAGRAQLRPSAAPHPAGHRRRHQGPSAWRPAIVVVPCPLRQPRLPAHPLLRGDHRQAGGDDPAPGQDPRRHRSGHGAAPGRRPGRTGRYGDFRYTARGWKKIERQVIARVEASAQGAGSRFIRHQPERDGATPSSTPSGSP